MNDEFFYVIIFTLVGQGLAPAVISTFFLLPLLYKFRYILDIAVERIAKLIKCFRFNIFISFKPPHGFAVNPAFFPQGIG